MKDEVVQAVKRMDIHIVTNKGNRIMSYDIDESEYAPVSLTFAKENYGQRISVDMLYTQMTIRDDINIKENCMGNKYCALCASYPFKGYDHEIQSRFLIPFLFKVVAAGFKYPIIDVNFRNC